MVAMLLVIALGILLTTCFAILCMACGLYFLADLAEEHTAVARRIINGTINAVVAIHILLFICDGDIPWWHTALSVGINAGVYRRVLRSYPDTDPLDPAFVASCAALVVDHLLWFQFLVYDYCEDCHIAGTRLLILPYYEKVLAQSNKQNNNYSSGGGERGLGGQAVVAAMFVLTWLVPLMLFVSMSAGEYTLPQYLTDDSHQTTMQLTAKHRDVPRNALELKEQWRNRYRRRMGLVSVIVHKIHYFLSQVFGVTLKNQNTPDSTRRAQYYVGASESEWEGDNASDAGSQVPTPALLATPPVFSLPDINRKHTHHSPKLVSRR